MFGLNGTGKIFSLDMGNLKGFTGSTKVGIFLPENGVRRHVWIRATKIPQKIAKLSDNLRQNQVDNFLQHSALMDRMLGRITNGLQQTLPCRFALASQIHLNGAVNEIAGQVLVIFAVRVVQRPLGPHVAGEFVPEQRHVGQRYVLRLEIVAQIQCAPVNAVLGLDRCQESQHNLADAGRSRFSKGIR